ncbi:MAG: hypothetical protein IJ280_00110 [Bacteroidales bacterium]|nr:hypothetical protein [Bacteroidales bacterium]
MTAESAAKALAKLTANTPTEALAKMPAESAAEALAKLTANTPTEALAKMPTELPAKALAKIAVPERWFVSARACRKSPA